MSNNPPVPPQRPANRPAQPNPSASRIPAVPPNQSPAAPPTTPTGTPPGTSPMPGSAQGVPLPGQQHDVVNSELLLRIYLEKRVQGQIDYYTKRRKEFESNIGFMVSIGAGIMAVSALVSAIGAASNSPVLAVTTALLPALAALVAGFRQLYQWEKQASLYRDAALGLEDVKLIKPDDDVFHAKQSPSVLPRLVQSAESVFTAEINQWGQIALGLEEPEPDPLNRRLLNVGSQLSAQPPTTGADFNDDGVG